MAKISLPYGQQEIDFEYDPNQWEALAAPASDLKVVSKNDILVALANPIDGQPLEEIVDVGEQVLIVVSDKTRATASDRVVPLLVGRLLECGLRISDISVIFATGIHRQPTESEKRQLLTDAIYEAIRHYHHNPANAAELVYLGDTPKGTPVELNRHLVEADHVILTGSIGFHYFAGFTGGRKSVLPGLASAQAIARNHLLAVDFSAGVTRRAGVGSGRLDGNAVHEDMEQACALLAPSFVVNTVLNEQREIVQIFCGDWRTAHRRGCAEYAERHTAYIDEKRDLVIASCGGTPKDINLIQAHKALDMAVGALNEGGNIILLAECQDGLGRDDFLNWFESPNAAAIGERLQENYQVNGQTAWALATKTERFRITLVSQLSPDLVGKMGMQAAPDLATALATLPSR
ncbi:MAG: nickel-dependent lactate racemase, partial [Acidobacteriota bacterium]